MESRKTIKGNLQTADVSSIARRETHYHSTSNRHLSAIRPSLSVSLPGRFHGPVQYHIGIEKRAMSEVEFPFIFTTLWTQTCLAMKRKARGE